MKFIFTKEPGTWVMFAIAFVTGAIKTGTPDFIALLVFVSLTLFLLAKAPLASFLKSRDKGLLPLVIAFAAGGIAAGVYPVMTRPHLVLLYAAAAVLILFFFIFLKKGLPLLSDACGMAIMGDVACMAASINSSIQPNLYLWLFFFAFYFASSFRVRFTIRRYRVLSGVYSGLIVFAGLVMALEGRLLFLSFLPLVEDVYAALSGRRDDFKTLGIIETAKSILFAVILIAV